MFLVLGAGQLGVALAVRARGAARHNPFLAVAVLAAALLQVLAVTFPPLQELLNTGPLSTQMWLGCLFLSTLPGLLTWLDEPDGRHDPSGRGSGRDCVSLYRTGHAPRSAPATSEL
jgi:protein-S-isoprenylcysteine O-methyltransferase Ste14